MKRDLWDIFVSTGLITDYLNYVNNKNSEVQNDNSNTADYNKRISDK